MADLPPMPWRLRVEGLVLITLHWVDVERVRALVPPELRIMRFLPGKTLGGLFLARYGPGSELEYDELIVSGATVWHAGRPAAWATHLFVDEARSVEGGRTLLGAPKHLAPFARDEGAGHRVRVGEGDRPVCRVLHRGRLRLWRQRVRLAALHRDVRDPSGRTVVAHGNELRGRWGVTRAEVEIPERSPLQGLGFGKPVLSLCGSGVEAVLGGAPFLPPRRLAVSPPGGA
ncbi:MAG TPA: acetoacetate decarboxylase family protein [Longimicrobiaceae bacterium]|nr:acetoacetate decarboxylase family protein [Longimicrobiaceae bacterium]